MAGFTQRVIGAAHRLVWLDDTDYCTALLAGGENPWLDAGVYAVWRRKAHSLLKSDVVALDVQPLCAAWLSKDAALRESMSAKTRMNFPLKTLLASTPLRCQITEFLTALRANFPQRPLAFVCPSPRAWIAIAYRAAFGAAAELAIGEEEVDGASLHCADFLREFGSASIDTVLLEESTDSAPASAAELEWYRSVLNVAAHYRWDVGVRHAAGTIAGADSPGIDYHIGTPPRQGVCFGALIGTDFWQGEDPPAAAGADFRFACVPLNLQPERILDRLELLRQA